MSDRQDAGAVNREAVLVALLREHGFGEKAERIAAKAAEVAAQGKALQVNIPDGRLVVDIRHGVSLWLHREWEEGVKG